MPQNTSPLAMDFHGEASVGELLAALKLHDHKALVIDYGGRTIRRGYHMTEVKAGSFVALDCVGNPESWRETILQVEDLGPEGQHDDMRVGTFRTILDRVAHQIAFDPDARLTLEVGRPDAAMQVFDVGTLSDENGGVVMRLMPRPAICKPRHRAQRETATCCGPKSTSGACCAA